MKKTIILCAILNLYIMSIASAESLRHSPDLQTLVEKSDLIVTGKIKRIIDSFPFYGYDEHASELSKLDRESPFKLSVPATDYLLKVNKVLKSNAQKKPKQVVLRMLLKRIEGISQLNQDILDNPEKVKQQVFFMQKNPDGTYGINSIESIMNFKTDDATAEQVLVYGNPDDPQAETLLGAENSAKNVLSEIVRLGNPSTK